MCERVVAMVTRREKFARTMHQSIYADDLASVLALLTRQQEEIERLDALQAEGGAIISAQYLEIDALRAALTKIAGLNSGYWEELFDECQSIALAALQAKP